MDRISQILKPTKDDCVLQCHLTDLNSNITYLRTREVYLGIFPLKIMFEWQLNPIKLTRTKVTDQVRHFLEIF
jgi:hypothetical protein